MAGRIREKISDIFSRLNTTPLAELTRGQRFLRFMWQLWVAGYRQLRRDRASSNAAALTYRTLFALLPMLVLAATLTKVMVSEDTFLASIDELMNWLHLQDISVPASAAADGSQTIDLVQWVHEMAVQALAMDLSGLTWIGLVVVIYSAIRLVEEVDSTFNLIGRATPSGWMRKRIWVYLGIILLAPLLTLIAVWYLDILIDRVGDFISAWPWVVPTLQSITTLVMLWWLLRLCYRYIPERTIRSRPASIGAASATLLLLIGQWLLSLYITGAVRASPLGGGLGFVPVFMFWMYMMWLAVLYGLEITMVSQRLGDMRQRDQVKAG